MKRTTMLWAFIILVALAGAAYVAGQWMSGNVLALPYQFFGGNNDMEFVIERENAPEVPERDPDLNGAIVRKVDNSLFCGTENVEIFYSADEDGEMVSDVNFTGPEVEVLITNHTLIYCDTNWQAYFTYTPDQGPLQQEVAVCTLDDIEQGGSSVSVWGTRRGDRLTAEIVVYTGF